MQQEHMPHVWESLTHEHELLFNLSPSVAAALLQICTSLTPDTPPPPTATPPGAHTISFPLSVVFIQTLAVERGAALQE